MDFHRKFTLLSWRRPKMEFLTERRSESAMGYTSSKWKLVAVGASAVGLAVTVRVGTPATAFAGDSSSNLSSNSSLNSSSNRDDDRLLQL